MSTKLRPDFNLDDYIEASHQFSLRRREDVLRLKLKLWSHPKRCSIFWSDRYQPTSRKMACAGLGRRGAPHGTQGGHRLLLPVSMGRWIEGLELVDIRAQMAERLRDS